jgi:type I restriction enzyme M protein
MIDGRAAIVVADNVLFEGRADEMIGRKLLHDCDVRASLGPPTGIFDAHWGKANVLFFDRTPASATPWTETPWLDDLRSNKPLMPKTKPRSRASSASSWLVTKPRIATIASRVGPTRIHRADGGRIAMRG